MLWAAFVKPATEPSEKTTSPGVMKETNPYELVKQENDINIYTRWIPADEKRSARQVKVTFAVDAPLDQTLAVLLDDRSFTSWMRGTRDYRRLQTVNPGNWYSYIQFSIPWPLNDQDCIIHYEVKSSTESYKEILLTGDPDYLDVVDGVTRISHMEGGWRLVSAGPDRTLVEYVIFSRQPSSFPRWITDPIIQNNMLRTMEGFRRQVEQADKRTSGQADKRTSEQVQSERRVL